MSYPPDLYTEATPAVSAVFRPVDHSPELSRPHGNATHYLATGDSTGGEFGLYRWEMGPAPSGPDPHFHRSISESFFVLTGTVRLYDGERWIDAVPGDFLSVPQGGIHAFRNESGEPASMLLLFAPGAPREDYFGRVVHASSMTDEEREACFLRHDTFWV
jgi:mannose-6-phosphate isomerase-like protein (cupin superfamily)